MGTRSNDRVTLGEEVLMDVDWSFDPLTAIQQMVSARDWLEYKIEQAVVEARTTPRWVGRHVDGVDLNDSTRHVDEFRIASWADIAAPLGVSRQVAWRKYAHTIDD